MRILIVDNMKENLDLLEQVLKTSGYEVVSAGNGAKALDKLNSDDFDLIISDILMPVMDGFQLCRECKGDDRLKGISFVFYTAAYTDNEDEKFALSLGADEFIRKPVLPSEFVKIIRVVIRNAEKGKIKPKKLKIFKEEDVLKAHNERLLKKLEDKVLELESEISERKQAEKALQESEEKYRALFESSVTGTYLVSFEGEIENVSKTGAAILGFDRPRDLVGRNITDFYKKPEDRDRVVGEIAKADISSFEVEMIRSNGADIICRAFSSKVKILEDEFILTSAYDITEHKRAEKESEKRKEQYYSLVNSTDDSIYLLDRSATFLFINEKYLLRLGLPLDKALGRNYAEFHSKDNTEKLLKNIEKVFKTGKSHQQEYSSERDDRYFLRTLSPVKGPEGNVTSVTILSKDITELKLAEKALQVERDNLRNIFESMANGMYVVNQQYDILYVNNVLKKDFGAYEDVKCYKYFHNRDVICPWCKNQDVWDGKTMHWEWYSSENERTYYLTDTPLTLPDGSIAKVEIFHDITERKRVERALTQTSEKLQRAYNQRKILSRKLIDLLEKDRRQIAMELHDHIGQTLTSLKMNLEMIHGKLKPGPTELGTQMITAQDQVIQAIKDVKNVSYGLRPTMIDTLGIDSSLRQLFNEIQQQTDIAVHYFSQGIPKRFEEEKALAIYRIAQEALSNIISHARAKSVFVNFVRKDEKLLFSVEDNGVGFDQRKGMRSSKRKSPFGLLIMRERAIQQDGEFNIESRLGKGTYVSVEIPI